MFKIISEYLFYFIAHFQFLNLTPTSCCNHNEDMVVILFFFLFFLEQNK